mgnify:FL=1
MRDKKEGTPSDAFCEVHHAEGSNKDTDRHYRMLSFIKPVVRTFKTGSWLTAGDGLGREAIFLKKQGVEKVTCSNIWFSDFNKEKISERVEDCIELDISNPMPRPHSQPEFVLVKEALHHLSRPIDGLYKLLDLANRGLVLIEPHDTRCATGANDLVENSFLLSSGDEDNWESWGNYKYLFNVREFCKMAWALDLPHVLVRGFNDPTGGLYEEPTDKDSDHAKYARYLGRCQELDKLGELNKRPYNLIVCAILKKTLEANERSGLKDFTIIDKPSI